MSKITITIDGKEIQTEAGEYILNAARANDIFIPAICYLTRCSPTLACRICLVEADGKQVYACNAKAKDGMQITTSTENIEKERRAIMEVYDVNHPLQCGVCDQSGECELQNYTLEMGVDSQSYAIKDIHRPAKDWGHIHYDPGLCIVCERCVTVCKDMIGDTSLKTVPRGADAIDAGFKESMPKDAYAMWNKLNKSLIGLTSGGEMLDCTKCGECAAVCPVGALVDTHYIYTTNAWECEQIPATCGHCSAGCQIYYDVKHTSIESDEPKIYRVMNEWNYVSLCGAGRYGFDYQNRVEAKDEEAFAKAVDAFKKADTIEFTSTITNEEALILQRLKEKFGYHLINKEAKSFQTFLKDYSEVSGQMLWGSDLKEVHNSDFVVSVGMAIKSDNPNARYALNNSMKMNKGAGLYFHPVKDPVIEGLGKNIVTINHAPLKEEAVLYLLLDLFGDKEKLPKDITDYLASFHSLVTETQKEVIKEKVVEVVKVTKVDEESGEEIEVEEEQTKMVNKTIEKEVEVDKNALYDIVGVPAKFDETLAKLLKKKEKFALMVGPDFYTHPRSKNLARLTALIEKYSPFKLVIVPPLTNSLGVALINELDEERGEFTIGYNVDADFTLSALGDGDLDMPAINQQEGTLTSVNKRVNPTNQAVPYRGYELNDIANALGLKAELTVDYTKELPTKKGFKAEEFDNLPNHWENDGTEVRGYRLENVTVVTDENESVEPFVDTTLDGQLVYLANPTRQFTPFTHKTTNLDEKSGLYISEDFLQKSDFKEGDRVRVKTENGELVTEVVCDNKIGGDIFLLPTFDKNLKSEALFSGYRFSVASVEKV
ncbi:NADH-ubiquinone oxidoreductase chain G [hydrothermal vent metagenome]|uniref:NADH-ubiquinone oxidoreductase chain G n=1 Tax=hydrothermal vent metagenome TaxID=652676 RepID=A0A1W1C563_9ZZZZ